MTTETSTGRRPRLALLLPTLGGGGAERVLLTLAGQFLQRGIACDLLVVSSRGELVASVPDGVRLFDLQRRKARSAIPGLVRYLRAERPETLLSTLVPTNVAALVARKLAGGNTRVVIRIANRDDLAAELGSRWHRMLDQVLMKWLYPGSDAIIAISQSVGQWLARDGLADTRAVRVIYNPLMVSSPQHDLRTPSRDVPLLVACGRLAAEKDPVTLIEAFAIVRGRRHVELVVLGEGPMRHAVEAKAEALGVRADVTFAGFVPDPIGWMREASVFVHTARFEGFGNVLVEALAAGCPIVATDPGRGAVSEVLDGGRYGTLVPIGDAIGVANAVEAILDGRVRFPNPRSYVQKFSIEHITDQYVEALFPPLSDQLKASAVRMPSASSGRTKNFTCTSTDRASADS